jgi:hypothetical protein
LQHSIASPTSQSSTPSKNRTRFKLAKSQTNHGARSFEILVSELIWSGSTAHDHLRLRSNTIALPLFLIRTTGTIPGHGSHLPSLFGRKGGRLKKTQSSGADRRPSEFNIMGNEGVVSSQYTLEKIQQAQSDTRVTKLELEDVIHREEDLAAIFSAIQTLLSDERKWLYIKFIDSIFLRNDRGMDAASQLQKYVDNRQSLWDAIGDHAFEKPIMFQVKLEVAAETSLARVENMLTVLLGLNMLTTIDFAGALYGVRKQEIPNKLADLCRGFDDEDDHEDHDHKEDHCLREMIVLSMSFSSPEAAPMNNATMLLKACIKRLKGLRSSMQEREKAECAMSSLILMDKSAKRTTKETSPSKNLQGKGNGLISDASSGSKDRRRQHSPKRTRDPKRDDGASKLDDKLGHSKSDSNKKVPGSPGTADYDWAHKRRGNSPVRSQGKTPDFRWDKPDPASLERCVTR